MKKVSICLPNLNTLPFLPQRFETIFNQTFQDWELIVYDSYSDDGAWEYIQKMARREPRMRIFQGLREGIYPAWNYCIHHAQGEFIYIATSDDTMMPECLEKMMASLEANPDCGICQCELEIIDEKGLPYPSAQQWNHYTLGSYNPDLVSRKNKRFAPHDGMVHPALFTIYTSITQLLIRKTVFERIGFFDPQWGTMGDFEWEMRAGLVENCIYIPEKLATWRVHPAQATGDVHTPGARLKMIDMVRAAFDRARLCEPNRLKNIDIDDLIYFLERDLVELGYQVSKGYKEKLYFLLKQSMRYPLPTLNHILERLQKKTWKPWNCRSRYERLDRLLQKYHVPSPCFD